jgi:hypothetical protein
MKPADIILMSSAIHGIIGYCGSLELGAVITQDYVDRLNEYYIPKLLEELDNLKKQAGIA